MCLVFTITPSGCSGFNDVFIDGSFFLPYCTKQTCNQESQYYLRLREVVVHAPLDKMLLGCLQTFVISLFAIDPDQLLSKLVWKEFGHLARKQQHRVNFQKEAVTKR